MQKIKLLNLIKLKVIKNIAFITLHKAVKREIKHALRSIIIIHHFPLFQSKFLNLRVAKDNNYYFNWRRTLHDFYQFFKNSHQSRRFYKKIECSF